MLTLLMNNKIDVDELEEFEYMNDYFMDPEN